MWSQRRGSLVGEGHTFHRGEKKQQYPLSLSDVSEDMFNRVIWWLEGLCL